MKKIIVVILCLVFLGTVKVCADDYGENYDLFLGDTFEESIDSETKEELYSNGLDPKDINWTENIKAQNVFSYILSLAKGKMKRPFVAFFNIAAVVILFAAFTAFGNEKYLSVVRVAAPAVISVMIAADIYSCVTAAAEAARGCASFMIGFIPAFVSLVAASGKAVTSAASAGTMLVAANAVSSFAAYGMLPLMGGYFSISIASGVSPLIGKIDPASALKRLTVWILSLVSTVFLGVLSVQTAVSSAADNATLKTAKFLLGTSIPVAGSVLSEAAGAVSASVGLLKSSAGIYAAVVVAAIMLPVVISIILWRVCFALLGVISEMFGEGKTAALLKAVDSVFACLLGIVLLMMALFIISLGLVVGVTKTV